jgi:hypothetical protein
LFFDLPRAFAAEASNVGFGVSGQTLRDAVDDPPAFSARKNLKFSQFAGDLTEPLCSAFAFYFCSCIRTRTETTLASNISRRETNAAA